MFCIKNRPCENTNKTKLNKKKGKIFHRNAMYLISIGIILEYKRFKQLFYLVSLSILYCKKYDYLKRISNTKLIKSPFHPFI